MREHKKNPATLFSLQVLREAEENPSISQN